MMIRFLPLLEQGRSLNPRLNQQISHQQFSHQRNISHQSQTIAG
jgi:hypothetical protein